MRPDPVRVNILCQCGWGRLYVPVYDVPERCPICGYRFVDPYALDD
jgi:hypothetical protein